MIKKINFSAILIITCCVLFSTANASLLNLELGLPDIFSNSSGIYTYDTETGLITIRATPLTISYDGTTLVLIGGDQSFSVSFYVDSSGQFISGVGGDDLVIIGNSNVLLTGDVTNFGWHNLTNTNYAIFDFTFDPTGGELFPFFGDQTGGCIAFIEKSGFSGNWDEDHEGISVKIDTAPVIELSNQPPVAMCQDVTESTDGGVCSASASIDAGSYDQDGDPITLVQEPPGPYKLGDTEVTLTVTDDSGENDFCSATVTVIDDIAPVADCNAAPTIVPPDTPISFTATAEDNCGVSSVVITEYDCSFINGGGKLVDKKESCVVEFSGNTITIQDSGGVGDHITWTILAIDNSGNQTEHECYVDVVNPGE